MVKKDGVSVFKMHCTSIIYSIYLSYILATMDKSQDSSGPVVLEFFWDK